MTELVIIMLWAAGINCCAGQYREIWLQTEVRGSLQLTQAPHSYTTAYLKISKKEPPQQNFKQTKNNETMEIL